MKHIFLIGFLFLSLSGFTQTSSDTVKIKPSHTKKHSPKLASALSAVIPGAGQVYNRKYWKVPIIYAGLGGLGYLFMNSQEQYSYFRKNLINEADGDATTINETPYGQDQLQSEKLRYRKFRDLSAFGLIAVYAINIIDANVDAHLKTFDVSNDLSLHLNAKPLLTNYNGQFTYNAGIGLKLTFK